MAPRSTGGKIAPIQKKNDHSDGAKGVGSGRSGLKRHGRRAMLDGSSALSRPALRRLARRAGVKRINAGIYEEAPTAMRAWLGKVIADAAVYTEHARRMTVTINDVLLSLKRNGVTLYGFAMTEKRRRLTRPLQRQNLAAAAARVTARAATRVQPRTPREITAAPQAAAQLQFTAARPSNRKERTATVTTPPTVVPERAQDIQVALAAYRDTEIARKSRSDAPVNTVLEWINGHMLGRNKTACTHGELDIVLDALEEQDAVMLTSDEGSRQRTVWFVA